MRCSCCSGSSCSLFWSVPVGRYTKNRHTAQTNSHPSFTNLPSGGRHCFPASAPFLCALRLGRHRDRTPGFGGWARRHIQSKKFGKVFSAEDLSRPPPLGQRKCDVGAGDQLFFVDSMEPEKEFRLLV